MKLAGFGHEGEAYSGSAKCFHRALREGAGKLSLRGVRLGNEGAALPDLIKTGLEANSFRSEQEGGSQLLLPLLLWSRRDLENPSMGGCPLGNDSSWILQ